MRMENFVKMFVLFGLTFLSIFNKQCSHCCSHAFTVLCINHCTLCVCLDRLSVLELAFTWNNCLGVAFPLFLFHSLTFPLSLSFSLLLCLLLLSYTKGTSNTIPLERMEKKRRKEEENESKRKRKTTPSAQESIYS